MPEDMPQQPDQTDQPAVDGDQSVTSSPVDAQPEVSDKKIEKHFKKRIQSAKRNADSFYSEWKRNVELRLGKMAGGTAYTGGVSVEDEIKSEVNPDWSLTKTKTANLFSQVPTVICSAENNHQQYGPAIAPFAKALNYEISEKRSNVGATMEESLNDVVNASGVAAAIVEFEARFETVMKPDKDMSRFPQVIQQTLIKLGVVKMVPAEDMIDYRFTSTRIRPTDLIWPAEFVGSNFDDGDFIGHVGRLPWAVASVDFAKNDDHPNGLTADDKMTVTSGETGDKTHEDLRSQPDKAALLDMENVEYEELFYWRYRVDPTAKSFSEIWRIVFVKGKDGAVIHEPWRGQKYDDQKRRYIGNVHFPIRVLTVTYISDNPIPPSDSSAGRPQVDDMRRSRSQMFMNRQRSVPIRWFNPDKVDVSIQDNLMRGTVQGMIPVQGGNGDRAVGEIARASYPSEDFSFDQQTKQDLMELWQIGPSQLGTTQPGRMGKDQVNLQQQNFATRIGQERNAVSRYFLGICGLIAGYMTLYSDFPSLSDQERQQMQQSWDMKHMLHDLVLKIRPDSQVVLDTEFRTQRLMRLLNMVGKSGYVNPKPIISELVELAGLDPSELVIDPKPKPPEEPNISLRLTGKDDLNNVMVVAMLLHHGKMPTPQDIEQATQLLELVSAPKKSPNPQSGGAPGQPAGTPGGQPPPPGGPQRPNEDPHANWNMMPKIAKRSREMGGG